MLIDSHCHLDKLDLTAYDNSFEKLLADTKNSGVSHILCVAIDKHNIDTVLKIAENHDWITASVGIHPNETAENDLSTEALLAYAQHPKVVAIGETGLDYYRNEGDMKWQHDRFVRHIEIGRQTKKPLIIHTRQAREDTIAIMRANNAQEVSGVMHCFTEDWDTAKAALDLNFYISISGIVTFKNAKELHEVAKQVPLERLLIETDAPYLAPEPFRGKTNEPKYVRYVAEKIASLRGITFEEVAAQTQKNFQNLFSAVSA